MFPEYSLNSTTIFRIRDSFNDSIPKKMQNDGNNISLTSVYTIPSINCKKYLFNDEIAQRKKFGKEL